MIILALLVVLFFSISSISAQSISADNLDEKTIKSDSSSVKSSTATKVKTSTANKKTTSTDNEKTTSASKKASASATKENKTTVNKKTLAKTSTSFINYVEKKGKFPKVRISNKNYSNTEYLYLMTKAVENNSNPKIEINRNMVKKYNNSNSKSVKGSLNKTEYVKIAGKTRKFIEKNRRAPNWVSSSKGNIPYNQLILSYSKCLDFFNKNSRLPNTVRLDDLDLDKINDKLNKNKSESAVNASSKTSKQTSNKTVNKTTGNIAKTNANKTKNTTTKTASNKEDDSSKNASLVERTLNNIHNILNNILDRLDPSKYQADVTKTDEANVKLNTSKINVDINGKSTVNIKVSAKNTTKATAKKTATKSTVKKTASKTVSSNKNSINEVLRKCLASSKNCQVKNKEIQDLAKTLTSKLKSDYEKGKKLFNWVRDNIQYKKYRNTRRGAVKTLQTKKGNCVDQSHLLIALSRASGIPARYVKGGNCKFSNGYVSGHIWAQMYINKKWVVADTTSHRNTLGNIRNWNTKNYQLCGQFSSINF